MGNDNSRFSYFINNFWNEKIWIQISALLGESHKMGVRKMGGVLHFGL